jgi:hypothetical protein
MVWLLYKIQERNESGPQRRFGSAPLPIAGESYMHAPVTLEEVILI